MLRGKIPTTGISYITPFLLNLKFIYWTFVPFLLLYLGHFGSAVSFDDVIQLGVICAYESEPTCIFAAST